MADYTKTNWQNGDIITAEKLNNMEDGIAGSSSGAVRVILYDERLDPEANKYIGTGQTDPGLTGEELMSAVWIARATNMGGILTRTFPRDMVPFEAGGNARINLVTLPYSSGSGYANTYTTATYNSATGEVHTEPKE